MIPSRRSIRISPKNVAEKIHMRRAAYGLERGRDFLKLLK
jgi:hypothetical protein